MRLYLSDIREWLVEFSADMLFISIRTEAAWYRLIKWVPGLGAALQQNPCGTLDWACAWSPARSDRWGAALQALSEVRALVRDSAQGGPPCSQGPADALQ